MKIGINTVRKNILICFLCKGLITKKYFYEKEGKSILKYCEKCGKKKLMKKEYYNKEEGKLYGIERRI